MAIDYRPCEGSIFIMSYTECDYESEGNAALVYVLENNRLKPLLGVSDLGEGTHFNHFDTHNYDRAVAIVQAQNVTHVFTPCFNAPEADFYDQKLGYCELTEEPNENGEIECWFELGAILHSWEIISRLEALQIKVININPETKEVIK